MRPSSRGPSVTRGTGRLAVAAALGGAVACGSRSPTYYDDVAPILAARCTSCHRAHGSAPATPLETYEQVASAAGKVRLAVRSRMMPPWGADDTGLCRKWRGALWLSDAEIKTLTEWTEHTARGEEKAAPGVATSAPSFRADATLDTGADYAPGLGPSAYRCFVVQPTWAGDRMVTAFHFASTEPRSVEQVTVYALESEGARTAAASLEAEDPEPGYVCYGSTRTAGARLVTSWTWDAPVQRLPQGFGARLPGGQPIVIQIHYNPIATGLGVPTRTRIELEVDAKAREASYFDLTPDDIRLAPGQTHVEASARVASPGAMTVLGVVPRMHTRGRTMQLDRVGAGTECLGSFDHYDFYRQRLFEYEDPIRVSARDVLRVTCVYDTSGRTADTLRGERIDDEECLASLLVAR